MPGRYYHVMCKSDAWHLYHGDGPYPLMSDRSKTVILNAARRRARDYGAKVIVHKAPEPERTHENPIVVGTDADSAAGW